MPKSKEDIKREINELDDELAVYNRKRDEITVEIIETENKLFALEKELDAQE